MTDAFALFSLPRRPWLDADALRDEFHRRSAAQHPDAGGAAGDFAELNGAYRTLSEPVSRVRHLLELDAPEQIAGSAAVPAALGEQFMRSAGARQTAGRFLEQLRAASALSRALLAGERAGHERALDAALGELDAQSENALARLRALDATWRERVAELAQLHAELSYLGKWTGQLREARLQLDLAR